MSKKQKVTVSYHPPAVYQSVQNEKKNEKKNGIPKYKIGDKVFYIQDRYEDNGSFIIIPFIVTKILIETDGISYGDEDDLLDCHWFLEKDCVHQQDYDTFLKMITEKMK